MVGTKLRQQLGDLVQLLEKQVSAYDLLYKGGGDIDRKQHLEQVLELVKTLDSTKSPLGKLLKPQPDYNTKEIKLQGELLPLHRPSHHWKPRGLPALTRRSILTKLQRLEAPGHGFKVLVADESAVKALASYVTADELTCEAGVVLVEKISAERRSLDLLDAVYVVEPTSWNVEQIRADFELERAKYHRAHVLFLTDFVADNVRTKLQRDLGSHLASIGFLRADFQTAGPNSFHFGIHDAHSLMTSSVNGKRRDTYEAYGEDEEGNQRLLKDKQTLKQRKLIAEKLAHVCAQLGEINPAIRWQHGAEEQERHRSRFEHKEAADPLNRRKRMHTARTLR